jgi:hypothetical protein
VSKAGHPLDDDDDDDDLPLSQTLGVRLAPGQLDALERVCWDLDRRVGHAVSPQILIRHAIDNLIHRHRRWMRDGAPTAVPADRDR